MTKKTVILNNGGVPVFDTSMIQDELEVVQSVYPQADVVLPTTVDAPTSSAAGSVTLDMLVQWSGRTTAPKVTVAVDLVYGYPFVLPNISVVVHNHTSALRGEKDNDAALRDVEAVVQSRLTVSIRDATSAAVSAGQPCLLLLLAHVEEFFSQDPPPQRVAPSFDDMSVGSRDHLVPAAATKKSVAFSAPLPDDAVKAQQKQLRRLAALTLHMTQKCCELYSKESSEEANDNFLFLKQYLTDDVAIVPKEISERWDARKMLKAGFASFVENSEESEDVRLCLKWFWGTSTSTESTTTLLANRGDETAFTFDQRFAHDFIQQRRIGAGGFAPVFICRKIIDGKLYAVKKVAVLTHQSARALREVQMLAALDHENIVRYYDAWAEPGVDKDLTSFVDAIEDEAAEEDEEESDTTCTDSSDSEVSDASEAEEEEEDEEDDEDEYNDEEEHSSQAPSQCDEAMRLPPSSQKPPLRSAAASFFDSDSDDDDDDLSTGDRNGCSAQSTPALGSTTTHTSASSSRRSKDGVSVRQKSTNDGPSSHRLFSEDHSSMNGTSAYQRYRTLYIQMELCEAATLRHLIDSGKLLEDNGGEQLAASIFRQLLMVVAHVHSQQVVHRDLKPDNVLFQHQQHGKTPGHRGGGAAQGNAEVFFGAIKVADFGLARSMPKSLMRSKSADMDELTSNEGAAMSPISTGAGQFFHLRGATSFDESTISPQKVQVTTNCGTVLYCAPEQADGSTYDYKVDDYSVGMIALEMWLAVAGRDFRERFIILNQVTRAQGVLPIWFQQWRPKIAEIISSLLQFQPKKRSTCESILTRQDLPGEPTEIAQALHTLAQYGPKMVGRVFQRLEEHALASFRRRPVPHAAAAADSLKSTPLQVQHVMEMAAVLHCATQLPFIEPLLPLAPPLKAMLTTSRSDGSRTSAGNSVLMDDHGKCYIASSFPQLSAASFLATHRTAFQENSFTFHYNKTGRPSFNFGTLQSPTTMDIVLQPILFTLDVLSRIELSEGSRLIMTLFARSDRAQSTLSFEDECGRGESDPALESKPPQRSRQHVASLEDLRDYLAVHEQDFSPDDLHELKFIAAAIFNAAPQMFRCTTDMPLVFVSAKWSMEEDEALVDASMLTGIVVSCEVMTTGGIASTANSALTSTTASKESFGDGKKVNHASGKKAPPPATSSPLGQGSAGRSHTSAIIAAASTPDDDTAIASSSTLVAVGCHLLPFAALFNPYHDTHAFMMSFDLAAMQTVTRRVIKRLLNASTILDGVVVSAGDGVSDASGGGGPAVPQPTAPPLSGGGSGTPVHVPTSASAVALRMPSSCSVGGGGVTPDLVVLLAKLLAAGHRIFPRSKIGTKDVSAFKESSPGRQHSWWITEALKLLWIPSVVNHKANRHEVRHEVHMETIVRDVRTIMAAAAVPGAINPHTHVINMGGILGAAGASTVAVTTSSGGASGSTSSFTMPTSMKVDFTGREDSNAVLEARENLIHLLSVVHQSSIIAVACTSSEVRRCFIDFMDAYDRTPASSSISIGAPPSTADAGGSSTISPSLVPRSGSAVGVQGFVDWLKRHFVSTPMCMVPVFCLVDKRLEILVHHQRLKQSIRGKLDPPNKKNGSNGGHKKNGKYT